MVYKEKKCSQCGIYFIPISGNQSICSSQECKSFQKKKEWKNQTIRRRTKTLLNKSCLVCEEVFIAAGKTRKYCGSAECEKVRCQRKNIQAENNRSEKLKHLTKARKKSSAIEKLSEATEYFSKFHYTVLSQPYTNSHTKIKTICPEGHEWFVSFHAFKSSGTRCNFCYKESIGQSLGEVEQYFYSIGYTLLEGDVTKKYTVADKLKYRCSVGHEREAFYYALKTGNRCHICFSDGLRREFNFVKEYFLSENYIVLNDEYINNKEKLRVLCPKEHEVEITYSSFLSGVRCAFCFQESRKTPFKTIVSFFKEKNYKLLSSSYTPKEKLKCICPKGHMWQVYWVEFFNVGTRCKKCFCRTSGAECEIADFLEDSGAEIINNDRSVISPYELDIYIPAKKLAIEYCGLYWHGEKSGRTKDHIRHKLDLCTKNGIRLITIFEDEFLEKKDIVLSRLLNTINKTESKVYARQCIIQEISPEQSRDFLKENHIQGSCPSKLAFGLFYRNMLIQVMTFGNLSRPTTKDLPEIELKRLASRTGVNVVGGASKLFKRGCSWARKNNYKAIRSYCDLRWSNYTNTIYDTLGFKSIRETKRTPHYVIGQKRYGNQALKKTIQERLTGKTEWELRQEQGYDRIWDCGHRTYLYTL